MSSPFNITAAAGKKHAHTTSTDSDVSHPPEKTRKFTSYSDIHEKKLFKDPEIPPDAVLSSENTTKLTLTFHTGDMFLSPPNSVLIHACNAQGLWGAGIALTFKSRYPQALKVYRAHCRTAHSATNPVPSGSCLLIPPCESNGTAKHWIACLFTSKNIGKKKDSTDVIVRNTDAAVTDMLRRVREAEEGGAEIGQLRMCRINSGKFGVPWEMTEDVLKNIVISEGERREVEVWTKVE
jgi:ADP-ribose 1''-phosphate phosphatase